jgi:hypothetical protein
MSTAKHGPQPDHEPQAAATVAPEQPPRDAVILTPADRWTMAEAALDGKPALYQIEFQWNGQRCVAWRDMDGLVQIENRGH